jgi:hypothetical protein
MFMLAFWFLVFAFSISHATLKLSVSPVGVKLLSAKNTKWDTVVVETYVYNSGDATYYNTGTAPLLIVDIMVDSLSIGKHFLKPKDSLETFTGFKLYDTVTVAKVPFALVNWIDPLRSFQKESAVEELRVTSIFIDLHPKMDTIYLAGCGPGGTTALSKLLPKNIRSKIENPYPIYNVIGQPLGEASHPSTQYPVSKY